MPEVIECPECQRKLSMREEFLGADVKCPSCGATFVATLIRRAPPPPVVRELPQRDEDRRAKDNQRQTYDLRDDDFSRRQFDDEDEDDDFTRRRRYIDRRRTSRYDNDDRTQPDRGGAVLTLGILGLVFSCVPILGWILGGIALGMANTDLNEMSRGRMRRDGEGATHGGKICGLIAVILSTVFVFLYILYNVLENDF